jgi:hypothetical protein
VWVSLFGFLLSRVLMLFVAAYVVTFFAPHYFREIIFLPQ